MTQTTKVLTCCCCVLLLIATATAKPMQGGRHIDSVVKDILGYEGNNNWNESFNAW